MTTEPEDQHTDDRDRPNAAQRRTREAEEAHGGSMAPGLVDETGHPTSAAPATDRSADAD